MAALSAKAAIVSVGLAVADVGNTAEPRMKRLGWSWLLSSLSTTALFGSLPNPIVEELKSLNANEMTPIEALALLSRLVDQARQG